MDKNQIGIVAGIGLIIFGALMGAWHLLATGISTDFGAGLTVGFLIASGMLALLSRKVRDID